MHRFSYQLEIDPLMLSIVVPKMTLQPLVENCIQHGFNDRMHTLEIKVLAFIDGASWEIQINDNGSGFSAEGLTALNKKVDGYLNRMYSSMEGERLSLGGMGVASTISRLKFMFKEQFSYTIGNNEDSGGAKIRLRGPLKR
jgi:two-component system sensor histidine kinase YesM